MKSRSVSITGATGFVGWHTAEAFRDAGWTVRGVVRPGSTKPLPTNVERVESALERETLARAFDGTSLSIHAAAVLRTSRPLAYDLVNVAGTREVVRAANAAETRLMLISSLAAAGAGTPDRPRREADIPQPVTAYGRSKLDGEAVLKDDARVPWMILRPSAVYGPRDRGFLPLFGLAARGVFPQIRGRNPAVTLIHVQDLVRALLLAAGADGGWGTTLFLGHGKPEPVEDLGRGLARAVGRPYRPLRIPSSLMRMAAAAGDLVWKMGGQPMIDGARVAELLADGFVCSVDRAADVIGFTASTGWAEGALQTARWYREAGWL